MVKQPSYTPYPYGYHITMVITISPWLPHYHSYSITMVTLINVWARACRFPRRRPSLRWPSVSCAPLSWLPSIVFSPLLAISRRPSWILIYYWAWRTRWRRRRRRRRRVFCWVWVWQLWSFPRCGGCDGRCSISDWRNSATDRRAAAASKKQIPLIKPLKSKFKCFPEKIMNLVI